ncbi:aldose epimerase [Paenibacillus sp. 32O-W]|uniref:aldose 1-epimerase n=1 Tax=Paenibacillus sp. 32O-W TaxID=1695218 RepID=UPI000721A9C6|nr:aldose 1-epimerase [Paenibacillus sp. 32O-W]ALS28468.1 aldose epimerase [Paenibacillus sp. 32O-W]
MSFQAYEGTYQGERAVWLKAGPYEAALLPDIGANLIAFRDTDKGWSFIREPRPGEMAEFKARPMVHGIPVLFPPNRYQDGTFTIGGKTYIFPVNEEKTGNHLHGFFYDAPWEVRESGTNAEESFVVAGQAVDENHPAYRYFPHRFDLSIRYALSGSGLTQTVAVTNRGDEPMPCMLGFHTAVNVPFAPGSGQNDCKVRITIGERWALDDRMLPTGETQPLDEGEAALKRGDGTPFYAPMDNHYSAEPVDGRNVMTVTDHAAGYRFVYDAGVKYKQWMVWNNGAAGGFFCPEPQINMVNAPNLDLPRETTGLLMLAPGETWSETSRMYTEQL